MDRYGEILRCERTQTSSKFIKESGTLTCYDSSDLPLRFRGILYPGYHLYVALACPWADGTLAALFMRRGLTVKHG